MSNKIYIDFETRSKIDISKSGAVRYSEDPTTEIICLAYALNDEPYKIWTPPKFRLPQKYEELRTADIHHKLRLIKKRFQKAGDNLLDSQRRKWNIETRELLDLLDPDDHKYKLKYEIETELPSFFLDREEFEKMDAKLEAHNAAFEQYIWKNKLVPSFGVFETTISDWDDSMAQSAANNIPLSLAKGAIALDLEKQKDMNGRAVMLQLSKPKKPTKTNPKEWYEVEDYPDKFDQLYSYCLDDVATERDLSKTLPDLSEKEREVWELDQTINQRGLGIDLSSVDKALQLIDELQKRENDRLKEITGGKVAQASLVTQLLDWCNSFEGVDLPNMQAETIETALVTKQGVYPDVVLQALEIRSLLSKSSTKKLMAMKTAASLIDKTVKYTILYCGATATGRWAGRLIQPQNLPRGEVDYFISEGIISNEEEMFEDLNDLSYDEILDKYKSISKFVPSLLRGLIIPHKDHIFISADYSAIEARIVLWYAGEEEALTKLENGVDIYKDMAAFVYEKEIEDVTKGERQLGKQIILGAGFGMGAPKFMGTCQGYGMEVDEELAETAIRSYRNKYSGVPSFWYATEEAAINATMLHDKPFTANNCTWLFDSSRKFLTCKLPSGRKLNYYDAKVYVKYACKYTDDSDKKFKFISFTTKTKAEEYAKTRKERVRVEEVNVLTHMGLNDKKQWVRMETYGGKLVENIVQGTARDCMVQGLFNVEEAGYLTSFTVHDEIVSMIKYSGQTDDELQQEVQKFEQLLVDKPDWADGLPLEAEGWYGFRFKK